MVLAILGVVYYLQHHPAYIALISPAYIALMVIVLLMTASVIYRHRNFEISAVMESAGKRGKIMQMTAASGTSGKDDGQQQESDNPFVNYFKRVRDLLATQQFAAERHQRYIQELEQMVGPMTTSDLMNYFTFGNRYLGDGVALVSRPATPTRKYWWNDFLVLIEANLHARNIFFEFGSFNNHRMLFIDDADKGPLARVRNMLMAANATGLNRETLNQLTPAEVNGMIVAYYIAEADDPLGFLSFMTEHELIEMLQIRSTEGTIYRFQISQRNFGELDSTQISIQYDMMNRSIAVVHKGNIVKTYNSSEISNSPNLRLLQSVLGDIIFERLGAAIGRRPQSSANRPPNWSPPIKFERSPRTIAFRPVLQSLDHQPLAPLNHIAESLGNVDSLINASALLEKEKTILEEGRQHFSQVLERLQEEYRGLLQPQRQDEQQLELYQTVIDHVLKSFDDYYNYVSKKKVR